jgi:hypothetical protein
MSASSISSERKTLYYLGMVLIAAGLALFLSNFFFLATEMGKGDTGPQLPKNDVPMSDPQWWEKSKEQHEKFAAEAKAKHQEHGLFGRNMMIRALGGMGLMVLGGLLMRVGAAGWAGAGVVLNPEQARKDLEPWARMGGGVLQDALSEVDLVRKAEERLDAPPPVKIRCRKCQALSDETARFCSQCGSAL